jgi:hypothetical protein
MKTLIIITALLLLNCADNITNKHYGDPDSKTWCSVEKWNNGDIKKMYTIDPYLTYDNGNTEVISVSVDSVRADSIFISNETIKAVIVHEKYSGIEKIAQYNVWYDYDMEEWGVAEMYKGDEEFEQCSE